MQTGVQPAFSGDIVVERFPVDLVDHLLLPRIHDAPGFAVHVAGEKILVQHGMVPLQRLDESLADVLFVEGAVMPVGQIGSVRRAEVVHEEDDAFRMLRVKRIALRPDERALEQVSHNLLGNLSAAPVGP